MSLRPRLALLIGLLGLCLPAVAGQVVGGEFEYTIQPGDYLIRIGARFGQDARLLAEENAVPWEALIHPGQRLRVNNRHVVPAARESGIIINVPQRMLFFFRDGRLAARYPVGVGRPSWPTPLGLRAIRNKEIDKAWFVPPSIQEEMRREGLPVLTRVPPGPENPLGRHWMGLKPGWWGIHGTTAPASVYDFRSHGCIRLHPDDAAELFEAVQVEDAVQIVYRPVLLGRAADGTVYLEVHPDIYNRGDDPWNTLRQAAEREGVVEALDLERVRQVMGRAEGIARPVGRLWDTDDGS